MLHQFLYLLIYLEYLDFGSGNLPLCYILFLLAFPVNLSLINQLRDTFELFLPILYCIRPENRLTLIEVHIASLFSHLMLSNPLALQLVFLVWQRR